MNERNCHINNKWEILGVRLSELSMDMIINLIQDLTYLEMVPLVKIELFEL